MSATPGKRDHQPEHQAAREALLQEDPGEHGDEIGARLTSIALVPASRWRLGGVEGDGVETEPERAVRDTNSQAPAARQPEPAAARPAGMRQRDAADHQAAQGQRAGVEVGPIQRIRRRPRPRRSS